MNRNDEKDFQRIMAIDYLKSFAVVLVILTHALSKNQRLKIGGPFWISMAVPIFMILSGFTNSLSADKNKIHSVQQFFMKDRIKTHLLRILIPYLTILLLELFVGGFQSNVLGIGPFVSFTLKDFIIYALTGGTTPGSYYIPLLVQFVVIFPFMLILFKKAPKISILLSFSLHLLFDAFTYYLSIPAGFYRISIFRYLAFIIMGITLYHFYDKVCKSVRWLAFFSLAYIGIYAYLGEVPKIFSRWTNTSLPTIFWALALVVLGMTYLEKANTTFIRNLFSRIGQASYQIFLIQKFLFGFGLNRFFRAIHLNYLLSSIFSVLLCCFLGLIFHAIQLKIQVR